MNVGSDTAAGTGQTIGAVTAEIARFEPSRLLGAVPPNFTWLTVEGNVIAQRTGVAGAGRSLIGRALMQLQGGVWTLIAGEILGTAPTGIGDPTLAAIATAIVNIPNGAVPARPFVGINGTGIVGLTLDWGVTLNLTIFSP